MNRSKLMYVTVAAQVLFLFLMTTSYYAVDLFGRTVLLKTMPFDPNDVLYGDYVHLQYDISEIPVRMLTDSKTPEQVKTLYVVLDRDHEGHGVLSSVHAQKPSVSDNQILLKGHVTYLSNYWDRQTNQTGERVFHVTYGIEKYFVPQGKGKGWEQRGSTLVVDVEVAPWGQMKVKDIRSPNTTP